MLKEPRRSATILGGGLHTTTLGGTMEPAKAKIRLTPKLSKLLETTMERCPICKTAFQKNKAQCVHMRRHKEHVHVQAQKYAIVPAWRKRRAGKKGQMK